MKKQRFEDLEVWKHAYQLSVEIFKAFKGCKDYSFKDQITRASLSMPSNIAEGYERDSNKEFIHFLYIAKGSCGELRAQLYIAIEIGYLEREVGIIFIEKAKEISYMLNGLIQKRKSF
ncbi:MAG: four helix bundle protein [Nitrospinae bacterium]|nr:four helix bundle protein [Nitrospinota bacterium]